MTKKLFLLTQTKKADVIATPAPIQIFETAKIRKIIDMDEELLNELRNAAFEVLLLHPATTRDTWVQILIEQYPAEVADALGTDTETTRESLEKMWHGTYTDTAGNTRSYAEWAALFATEEDITEYYKTIPM